MDKEKIDMVKNGEVKLEDIQEPSTDLSWTSKEEHKVHFTQHNNLKLDEYNYFESVRARTGNWSNSYCYFNGVALLRGITSFTNIIYNNISSFIIFK